MKSFLIEKIKNYSFNLEHIRANREADFAAELDRDRKRTEPASRNTNEENRVRDEALRAKQRVIIKRLAAVEAHIWEKFQGPGPTEHETVRNYS